MFIHIIAPTAPPQLLIGFALSSRSIHLSWSPPPVVERNGIIREYKIEVLEVETEIFQHHVTLSESLVVLHLHPDYT